MKRKNGQGSISLVKSPNGETKYRMRQQVGVLPNNGRPRILTVTGSSETDCIRKMKKRERELADLEYTPRVTMTVGELCELHLKEHLAQKDRLKPKSADRRESTIRNQIQKYPMGRLQMASVKPSDITDHIESLISEGLSVSSVSKAFDVINAAYNYAKDQGYITKNPCDPVKDDIKHRLQNLDVRNSSAGVVIILSDEQIAQIKKHVNDNIDRWPTYKKALGLSVLLLIHTGMRSGEMCGLRWKDYNRISGTININKTRNVAKVRTEEDKGYKPNENSVKNYHSRTLALDQEAINVLNKMYRITPKRDEDDYILLNRLKNPSNPSNYSRNIREFYKEVGLPEDVSGAHILRRTLATKMHNNGCRLEEIAAYLGDTPETVLKHYISLTKIVVVEGQTLNVVPLPQKKDKL